MSDAKASQEPPGAFTAAFLDPTARSLGSVEAALRARGVAVPLPHCIVWNRCAVARTRRAVVVSESSGQPAGLFMVDINRSRALPTHRLWRVSRFGRSFVPAARAVGLRYLAARAREERVLRVSLECLAIPPLTLSEVLADVAEAGFRPAPHFRQYAETILLRLDAPDEVLLGRLQGKTRRDIRAAAKHQMEVRAIDDARWIPRMEALLQATFARTGGRHDAGTLVPVLALAREHPDRARVVGLFRSGRDGDGSLLAFAVGYHHGDHVEYATAASDRPADVHAPLGYALAWDLVRWARDTGATWLDFGGITSDPHDDADARRGGIADFKRYFSANVVTVAAEWELEPHPFAARLAGVVSRLATAVRRPPRTPSRPTGHVATG